jgi:hypothetical protein
MLEEMTEHNCSLPKVIEYDSVPMVKGYLWWKKRYTHTVELWRETRHLFWTCPECGSKWEFNGTSYYSIWSIVKDKRSDCDKTEVIYSKPLTSTRWAK